jgi:hypothetical protein
MELGASIVEQIAGALSAPPAPAPTDTKFLRRRLAQQHANDELTDEQYLERLHTLRAVPAEPEDRPACLVSKP